VSSCEAFWVKCSRAARKVAVFENVFKQETKLWLCDDHATQFSDVDFRLKMLDGALDSLGALHRGGMKMPIQKLLTHPAQLALTAHQATCERCAAVRDWIVREQTNNRIVDQEGINRVGRYVIEHCCEEGERLNYEVGLAMQGG